MPDRGSPVVASAVAFRSPRSLLAVAAGRLLVAGGRFLVAAVASVAAARVIRQDRSPVFAGRSLLGRRGRFPVADGSPPVASRSPASRASVAGQVAFEAERTS